MNVLIELLLMVTTMGIAQDSIDGFLARSYKGESGVTMPYRLFVPAGYNHQTKYPLILWLHGSGGAGSDNLRQISGDQIPGTRLWTQRENQARSPSFVVVPQSERGWLTNGPSRLSPPMLTVLELIHALQGEFNIDPQRIYIAGQSNGGLGAWALLENKPDLFAGAVLVSAGVFRERVSSIPKTPLWAFEGAEDDGRLVAGLREMIGNIKKEGGNPRYTEYERAGHDIWERAFKEPGIVEWLFAQHK